MTVWALLLAAAVFAAVLWWGSNVIFHPPAMIPLTVWPEQFGLRYEAAVFRTKDGVKLKGWLIPAESPTERTVLVCHGWGDNKGDVLSRTRFLHPRFNLFLFDSRAHGESEGDRSTIGYLEARDFEAALRCLGVDRPAWTSRLGVFGLSMGGAMAVYGMAQHPGIRCAVLEAPFASFNGVVGQYTWNHFHLPYFPFAWLTLQVVRLRLGADPESLAPMRHIGRLAPRPVLFIAGGQDRLMPLDVVRELYDACGEPKDLLVVPEAAHAKCQEVAGPEYERRIEEFFIKGLS